MLSQKKIKLFEKEIIRLCYAGLVERWIGLEDAECRLTLTCQVIPNTRIWRDHLKEGRGFDIDTILPDMNTNTILITIDEIEGKLLRIVEPVGDFSIDMIPELKEFYKKSNDLNLWGAASLMNPKFNRGLQAIFAMFCIGFVFSLIFKR